MGGGVGLQRLFLWWAFAIKKLDFARQSAESEAGASSQSDNDDLMAEHAVRCEPSSAEVPCQQGKLQGLGPEKPVLFRKEEKHRFDFVPVNPVETRTMGYGKQRIVSRTSGKRIPCYTPRFNGKGGA